MLQTEHQKLIIGLSQKDFVRSHIGQGGERNIKRVENSP